MRETRAVSKLSTDRRADAAMNAATYAKPPSCRHNKKPAARTGELADYHRRVKSGRVGLFANAQFSNDIEITLRVLAAHIVQQTSATADQTQQTTPRSKVLAMGSHVFS